MSTEPSNADDPQLTSPDGPPGQRTGLQPGAHLAGRYEVDRLIGEGGMGDVYLAKHLKIDKLVAIKVLAPEQTRRPRTVSRFLQEAKATSKIRHDNVVDITDFGEDEGRAFFVMEYFEGEDLRFMLKREGRITWTRAKAIVIQLLEGLAAAHDAGIVHRDVKPHNCFITPREANAEFLKIIDFGIAKLRDGSEEQLTRTGAIMGTAEYMSPEQGQGAELDGRSDLYSVGVILYRMLVGEVPFSGGNAMAILYQHVNAPPKAPSEACPEAGLGSAIDALVLKALAKEPDQRFASAREFIAAIRAIDETAATRTDGGGRSRAVVPLIAGAVLAVGIGAWVYASRTQPTDSPPEVARAAAVDEPARGEDPRKQAAPPEAAPAPETKAPAEAPPPSEPPPEDPAPEDAKAPVEDAPATPQAVPARRGKRQLQSAFGKLERKVKACAKQSGLFPGEKVTVSVTIAPDGKASKVGVTGAHASAGEACIRKAVRRARFGAAQRSQKAEHRFTI